MLQQDGPQPPICGAKGDSVVQMDSWQDISFVGIDLYRDFCDGCAEHSEAADHSKTDLKLLNLIIVVPQSLVSKARFIDPPLPSFPTQAGPFPDSGATV